MGLKIFLGFLAICFVGQAGFDFAHSHGYINIQTTSDYITTGFINLTTGAICLYFLGRK